MRDQVPVEAVEQKIRRLKAEFETFDAPPPEFLGGLPGPGDPIPATAAGKVALFRAVFRG